MITWQITSKNQLSKLNSLENLEHVDDVKVKITKCLITKNDLSNFSGANTKPVYPIIPCNIAVGQITETLQESNYFQKGQKVYVSPLLSQDISYEDECNGITPSNQGLLKEFAVINKNFLTVLPASVNENDALYINYISLAFTIIDKLKIDRGEYVAVIGGTLLGNIICQLLNYYKSVPILIDNDDNLLELARKTDVYYSIKNENGFEKEIAEITGGRMCKKVIYIQECNLPFEIVSKISSNHADIAVSGICSTKQKLNLPIAFDKQFKIQFIKSGYANISSSINLLVQKAFNFNYFKMPEYKFDYAKTHFENYAKKMAENQKNIEFTINLL